MYKSGRYDPAYTYLIQAKNVALAASVRFLSFYFFKAFFLLFSSYIVESPDKGRGDIHNTSILVYDDRRVSTRVYYAILKHSGRQENT